MLFSRMYRALLRPVLRRFSACQRLQQTRIESQLSKYIQEQLDHEDSRLLPEINGWSTTKVEGQLATVFRESAGQKVTVQFGVNGTMPTLEEQDAIENDNREILCYPAFEVMLEREGKKSVFVNCLMRNPDANNELPEDQEVNDSFAIMSMTVANKDDTDPYILNMDAMEDDFYDGVMLLLEELGITEDFCNELVRVTTDLETNTYLSTLSDFKKFLE